ncbi:hypothetical protein ACIB24_04510 [Spongisporangium articulatum]|uniref:Uncharacterized protein n=1 Tax=Spongisporangium articulatum TaxID=3362603 RepID=A0ABW8AIX4_9ACTN
MGTVVATVGGCGGAGASVLAAVLARAGARAGPVLLVDVDPHGGGLGALFAGRAATPRTVRAVDLSRVQGPLPTGALPAVLPEVDGVHLLDVNRSRLDRAAVPAVVAAARAEMRLVVVDLPRAPGGPAGGLAGGLAAAADAVLLVCPAREQAVRAARTVLAGLGAEVDEVHLVVRRPHDLPPALVAGELGVPLLAELPTERGLARAVARGEPPGLARRSSVRGTAEAILRRLPSAPGPMVGGPAEERDRVIGRLVAGPGRG